MTDRTTSYIKDSTGEYTEGYDHGRIDAMNVVIVCLETPGVTLESKISALKSILETFEKGLGQGSHE